MIEVKPKGERLRRQWRVEFLANRQPDIAVRTHGIDIGRDGPRSLKRASVPRMTTLTEPTFRPAVTDGEIAAINLESARRRALSRFAQDARLPGLAEAVVDQSAGGSSLAISMPSTVWRRSPRNSRASTTLRAALVQAEVASTTHRFADARGHLGVQRGMGGPREEIARHG